MAKINHRLVVGMTMSGKSLFCKVIARELKAKGKTVGVLDPIDPADWDADFATSDSMEFMKWAKAKQNAFLFVDEGAESIGRYNMEMEWLTTRSRHWGHTCIIITQRATQIPRTVRENCAKVYMFACGRKDSELFAEDWREPELVKIEKFKAGEFYEISRFDPLKKGMIYVSKTPLWQAVEHDVEFDFRKVGFEIHEISKPETEGDDDEPDIDTNDLGNDSGSDDPTIDVDIEHGRVSKLAADGQSESVE